MSSGGKNLIILGSISIFIAVLTTSISLMVYHDSGDIYLDRSRPGFLPDKKEIENIAQEKEEEEYKFSDSEGEIMQDELDEFLLKIDEELERLDAVPNPYSPDSISDEVLAIPSE